MCDSSNLLLNAASQNGTYAWWLNGSPLPFTGDQLLTQYPGGTYIAVVTVPGCGVYRDTVSITYSTPLSPSFDLGPDTLLCPKQVFTLSAAITGATAYNWGIGDDTRTLSTASSISITNPGLYWVFVTYNGQCEGTDTVNAQSESGKDPLTATINPTACDCQLLLPNAFTPDGDGRNDTFRPLHACEMTNFQMNIYDRYGELVFRSVNTEAGWDGTFHGTKVPAGTFVWMAHYTNTSTKQPVTRK